MPEVQKNRQAIQIQLKSDLKRAERQRAPINRASEKAKVSNKRSFLAFSFYGRRYFPLTSVGQRQGGLKMSENTISESDNHTAPQPDWEAMKKHWPSTIVSRSRISDFTGGVLSPGRMANLDCIGEGPPSYYGINRKVFYQVEELIEWMRERFKGNQNKRFAPSVKRRKRSKRKNIESQHRQPCTDSFFGTGIDSLIF